MLQTDIASADRVAAFARLTKFNDITGEFEGVLAEEAPDRSGEIFDYASSKPFFEAWSNGFQKATAGKSAGNLRAMHSKIAAGKFTSVTFDDEAKKILVAGKVIDSTERTKLSEGLYTGLSIGGKVVGSRWPDPTDKNLKRYTADPFEGSLVDLPCMYGATFTAIKDGGAEEIRKFRGPVQVWTCSRTEKHQHSGKSEAIACREKSAAGDVAKLALPVLEKGMYAIGDLCACIALLNSIRISAKFEAGYEGDDSAMPDALATEVEHMLEILHQMVDEEGTELLEDINEPDADGYVEAFATHAGIQKFLARIPASQLQNALALLERTTKSVQQLAADAAKPEETDMDEKVLKGMLDSQVESLGKIVSDGLSGIEKKLDAKLEEAKKESTEALAKFATDVEALKAATPQPPKLVARAVDKVEDGKAEEKAGKKTEPDTKDPVELAKRALAKGVPVDPRFRQSA